MSAPHNVLIILGALTLAGCASEKPRDPQTLEVTGGFDRVPAPCGAFQGGGCDQGQYCNYPDGTCKDEGARGVCVATPDVCIKILAPVCGCDGRTYSNSCEAAAAGVSIMARHACGQAPCGSVGDPACPAGYFCDSYQCDAGICRPQPTSCMPYDRMPVCGCDNTTYPSACEANRAGAATAYDGNCFVPPFTPSAPATTPDPVQP